MDDKERQERVKALLDDAMRFGAALGAFGAKSLGIPGYLNAATSEAFRAAQDVFLDEVDGLYKKPCVKGSPGKEAE